MTFPTTGIIDDFNRADEGPLSNGGKWTNQIRSGDDNLRVDTNQCATIAGGISQQGSAWWNNATFGPDCECYTTLPVLPTGGSRATVLARLANPGGGACDGYLALMRPTGQTTQGIYRYDNDVATLLGASVTPTWTAGDKLGIEIIGSTIRMMQYTSGAWSELASRTDTTYSAAGYIGIDSGVADTRFDDFSGGTVVSGTATLFRRTDSDRIGSRS